MSQLIIMGRIGMHLTIKPFWFEWWKLWAERDYRIPNTDCLVVPTPQASVGVLEHTVLFSILILSLGC